MINSSIDDSSLENFHKDRNVILKVAQQQLFNMLSGYLVKVSIDKYKVHFNPLGLVDETYQRILDYQYEHNDELLGIYENFCVVYRYKHGDNQLEIIWDGISHEQKYSDEWMETFEVWIKELTNHSGFVRAILQLTALKTDDSNPFFIRNYIKGIINDFFELKVLKRNGVKKVIVKTKELKVA
ncbi:MAG: hypothetical protein JXR07_12965 [Reichenbachiella sp.]